MGCTFKRAVVGCCYRNSCHISHTIRQMRQLRVSRAFVGLSLLLSCLVLHYLFSNFLFNKSDLAPQSVYVKTADSSGLHSIGPSIIAGSEIKSKTLPLDTFHNGPLGFIQDSTSNGNGVQGKVKSKIGHSSKLILLSSNRSVTSDVQGNLGAPSVITSESMSNWLTDRWQGRLDTSDITFKTLTD